MPEDAPHTVRLLMADAGKAHRLAQQLRTEALPTTVEEGGIERLSKSTDATVTLLDVGLLVNHTAKAHLREVAGTHPIVVLGPAEQSMALLEALHYGAADYLIEPLERTIIVERLGRLAQRYAASPVPDTDIRLDSLSWAESLEDLAMRTTHLVESLLQPEACGVVAFDETGPRWLCLRADHTALLARDNVRLIETETARQANTILINDMGRRQVHVKHAEPAQSRVVVPLFWRNQRLGAVIAHCTQPAATLNAKLHSRLIAVAVAVGAVWKSLSHQTDEHATRTIAETAQKRASDVQAELEEFIQLFDQIGDGVVVADHQGHILRANQRILRLLDLTPDDIRGTNLLRFIAREDRQRLINAANELATGRNEMFSEAVRVLGRSGEPRWFEITAASIVGQPNRFIVVLHDQTERKELLEALHWTTEYLENVINASPNAIIAADEHGKIVLFNESARKLVKWDKRPLGDVRNLYPDNGAFTIMRRMRANRAGGGLGTLRNYQTSLVTSDGAHVPIMLNAAILYDQHGNEVGSVGVFTDMRDIQAFKEELAHTRERLDRSEQEAAVAALAGTTAHHLNQPLTALQGYLQLLRRQYPEVADVQSLSKIEEAAHQIADIVREIGRITRFEVRSYGDSHQIFDLTTVKDKQKRS